MRRLSAYLLPALVVAACGGDDSGVTPDAGIDAAIDAPADVCAAPVTTLSTFPATYDGSVMGAGADITTAMGACSEERGYFGTGGEDHVVALTGLTPGTTYVLDLDTQEDLTMSVATACGAAGPASGACLLHVDETTGTEQGEFVAPAGGAVFVLIDTADDFTLTDGAYTLGVRVAECTGNAQCTTPGEPICDSFECVQCTTAFDCTAAATPVCDATRTCVAGAAACTDDDAAEQDDGPAAARMLAYPTVGVPTTATAAICNTPSTETDWYKLTAAAAGKLRVAATWTTGADLDFRVYDSAGTRVGSGLGTATTSEIAVITLPAAGTYYIAFNQYAPQDATAAGAYTLTLTVPDCDTSFQCLDPAAPVCDVGVCTGGPAVCTDDDAADTGAGDDGPAASRPLTGAVGTPVALTGAVCNSPRTEGDWYRVVVGAGEGLTVELAFTAPADLDPLVYDSTGRLVGTSFWLNPELVTLTYLPAGTYYVNVQKAGTAAAPAAAYTITATRTTAQTCSTRADCAATYATQLYRGDCTAGTCQFIAAGGGAAGAACDSADDCASGECSYSIFEADAHKSVCTTTCTTDADCAALGGGFACSTGFSTNVCLPSCTTDLECGADAGSGTLTSGQPWDYFTCTVATGACSP